MGAPPLSDRQPTRPAPLTAAEVARYVVTAAVRAPPVHNRSAGVTEVLTTAHYRPVDWVGAGQALQRILLTASTRGVAALHTQPPELGWLRESIRTGISDGAYPQVVPRFGTVIQAAVSIRRPPEDVLSASGGEHCGGSHA